MEKRIEGRKVGLTRADFITVRDLIPTTIYFVIMFLVRIVFEGVSSFHPILYACAPIFTAIFAAPIYMLFLAKVPKFGGVMFNAMICSILYLIMGGTYLALIFWIFIGAMSELVRIVFRNKRKFANILSYGIYVMAGAGSICFPFYVFGEEYLQYMLDFGMEAEYVEMLSQLFMGWMLPVLLVVSFVVGIIAGAVGLSLFKKQFVASGMISNLDDEDYE